MTCLHAAVLLFGVAALFGKWLTLAPALIVFGRTLVASAALGAFLLAQRESVGRCEWRLVATGAVLAVHWITFFQAIQVSTVAIGLLGFASFPLFIVILEAGIGGAPVRKSSLVAAVVVTLGLLLVAPEMRVESGTMTGLLWGLLSGFTFALLAIFNRAMTATRPASVIAWWQNSIAAVCTLPLVLLHPVALSMRDAALVVILGVVCTAAAHTLFIRSMKIVSAHTAGTVAALEPVYGIALAAWLLGEIPSPRMLAGAACIVGATLFVSMHDDR